MHIHGERGKGIEEVDRFSLRPSSLWDGPLSYHNVVRSEAKNETALARSVTARLEAAPLLA